jgi:hypothetical protein
LLFSQRFPQQNPVFISFFPPFIPHVPSISFFFIWSAAQHWLRHTDHEAAHCSTILVAAYRSWSCSLQHNIGCGLQIMKLLTAAQYWLRPTDHEAAHYAACSIACYLVPRRPKYLPLGAFSGYLIFQYFFKSA